ncbi:hypothetical protein DDB_G0285707 [Dictyostelium discoideum AX4]|uniref:Uncharacterized protein n=1 Tax=Dictyostelium discoideum TaxID=44689 RepID=Q54MR7_DICDI|nr:hypothetical protein DDB_G0285707 [Dictyostelium discoideum AX4]EAL64691.1 hypothetical protein DDB_G0285707 [Dictyostelium discoideum AX4]|eukprot:XP_638226.1 hypothetical protein DDB_G0285707 [Dictyostelium discoideum AX4]
MENNNYKLYKSVFGNKYLSNVIFKNVYKLNDQYYGQKESFTRCVNYEQASLEWILKNQKYELLYDKIKSNYKFSENDEGFSFVWIKKLVQLLTSETEKENNNFILLQKFYKNNLDTLKKVKLFHSSTNFICIGLLEFSIYTQSIDFLKLVYLDYQNDNKTKSTENDNIYKFLDLSLKFGNLDIIKFVHREMGIGLNDRIMALHFSMLSENRTAVVYYLLDEIKFKLPTEKKYQNEILFDKFFLNIMKLEFDLFKRLYELGSPLFFNKIYLKSLSCYFNNTFDIIEENKKTFIQFLNFFQNCIFLSAILSKSKSTIKRNSLLLKKIKHLINYNNNNNNNNENDNNNNNNNNNNENIIYNLEQDEYITIKENEDEKANEKEIEKKDLFKNGNWFSNFLKSKSKSTTTTTSTFGKSDKLMVNPSSNYDKFTEINYNNFNFEREIKRIYLFDYLKVENEIFMTKDSYMLMALEFKRKYQESEVFNDASFLNSTGFYESLFVVSVLYADYKLLEFDSFDILQRDSHLEKLKSSFNTFFYRKRRSDFQAFFLVSKDIEKQIEYIDFLCKLNICKIDSLSEFVREIILSKYFIIPQHADLLANLFKKYFFNSKKSNALVFVYNRELFKYFYKNYVGLFDWTSEIIANLFVKNDDIELIEFLHVNGISDLNLAIDFSQTLKMADFMIKLGYNFSKKSLETISNIDNSDETFSLFQLAFKSLQMTFSKENDYVDAEADADGEPVNSVQKTQNLIPIYLVSKNYRCLKFLEDKVLLGILHPSKVNILYSSPKKINVLTMEKLLPFFNQLYVINNVLDTFNYDIIDSFLNEYKSNDDNKNQSKYKLEIEKLTFVKIMKLHKSSKIRSLIEENINNNCLSVK